MPWQVITERLCTITELLKLASQLERVVVGRLMRPAVADLPRLAYIYYSSTYPLVVRY